MHRNTSLLLVRLATVLIFLIWACCQNTYITHYAITYLWCLARSVVRVAPQHDLTDLMQNAVSFLEIPLALFTCLVREVFLQEIEKVNRLLRQLWKVCLGDSGLARGDVPVHALNQYLHNIVTGISNMLQAVQTRTGLGVIACGVDEFDLVYTRILMYVQVYTGVNQD
jgi:O-antigen ligase